MGACLGLRYLHTNGITHGDFRGVSDRSAGSPQTSILNGFQDNVIASRKGQAIVTDFGLSKVLTSNLLSSTKNMGNPAWCAPELLEEEAVHTLESDVWACGMTILVSIQERYRAR